MTGLRRANRLTRALEIARGSLWLWPVLLGTAGLIASEMLIRVGPLWALDGVDDAPDRVRAARALLTTTATAGITVLGVVLTITLAVMAVAAGTYSPRVLRTLVRERLLHLVLGAFVALVVMSLNGLRIMPEQASPDALAVAVAALAVTSLGILVALFHRLARQIRVEEVIASIRCEAEGAVSQLPPLSAPPAAAPPGGVPIYASRTGRLIAVREHDLVRVAQATGGVVVLDAAAGAFVSPGQLVMRLVGGRTPSDDERGDLAGSMVVGAGRTMEQDVGFGLRQLADIALRALSPSLQDPTTADEALQTAGALLARLGDRDTAPRVHVDGRDVIVRTAPDFADLVDTAFSQVRRSVVEHRDAGAIISLVSALQRALMGTRHPGRRRVLLFQMSSALQGAERTLPGESDRAAVRAAAGHPAGREPDFTVE
jgi:uncharacterized membrane protein